MRSIRSSAPIRLLGAALACAFPGLASAAIEVPRGTALTFEWAPAPGEPDAYVVYGSCNGAAPTLRAYAFGNRVQLTPGFCDTLSVQVAAIGPGTSGGTGPLSDPSETIVFGDTLGSGGTPGGVPTAPSLDLDADGAEDILVHAEVDGSLHVFSTAGGVPASLGTITGVAARDELLAAGDFDGDGDGDLLARTPASGAARLLLLEGSAVLTTLELGVLSEGQRVLGAADPDADGRRDVFVFDSAARRLDLLGIGAEGAAEHRRIDGVPAAGQQPAALGDFDGDGRADVAWHDAGAATLGVWRLDGSRVLGTSDLPTGLSDGWTVAAAADFDADGRSDLLWRDAATGTLGLWFMDGGGLAGRARVDLRPLPGRVIVAAGDFDGDGHVDLLERRRSGTLAALLLDGTVARAKTPISKLAAGDRVVRSDGGAAR